MTQRQQTEAECRAICAEMVGLLRTISEGATPLTRTGMRGVILELEHELTQLARVSDQLP